MKIKIINVLVKSLLIHLMLFSCFNSLAQTLEQCKPFYMERFNVKYSKNYSTKLIPMSFGSSHFISKCINDSLKHAKILAIKLVYTKYKEVDEFDQIKLNQKRIDQLIKHLPQIKNNSNIRWYAIQQTCSDSIIAKTLFHGFSIEYQYQKPIIPKNYALSDHILNTDNIKSQFFNINNHRDTILICKGGSMLYVDAHSFESKYPIKLEVKEAITMENIIKANLVTISNNSVLESGGMIYINASANYKPIDLKANKSISVGIPNQGIDTNDMLVWKGEKTNQYINWVEPQKQEDDMVIQGGLYKYNATLDSMETQGAISIIKNNKIKKFTFHKNYDIKLFYNTGVSIPVPSPASLYYNPIMYFQGDEFVKDSTGLHQILKNIEKEKIAQEKQRLEYEKRRKEQDIAWEKQRKEQEQILKDREIALIKQKQIEAEIARLRAENINRAPNMASNAFYMNVNNMNQWNNIDRYSRDSRTKAVDFFAYINQNEAYQNISIVLIDRTKKIMIPGYVSQNGGYGFSHGDFEVPRLPVGQEFEILFVGTKNGESYCAKQIITIYGQKQHIFLNPIAENKEKIIEYVKNNY